MMLEEQIRGSIRDIVDFPKKGIVFKDITPILQDPDLCREIVAEFMLRLKGQPIDVVVGVESRGFLFGMMLANQLNVPFVPIRKKGKLPYKTVEQAYDLEYGSAVLEIHQDAFPKGANVLVHDDLLATGGTIIATSQLIQKMQGTVVAFTFIVDLAFLKGKERLSSYSDTVIALVTY